MFVFNSEIGGNIELVAVNSSQGFENVTGKKFV